MIEKEFLEYLQNIKNVLKTQVQLATQARARKLDPQSKIESKLTFTSKAKIGAILNIPKLEEYLPSNLSWHESPLLLAADIAKQIVNGRFVKDTRENLILMALHSSLVILSQGLISVPHESIPKISIGSKSNHLTIYFSNTVRYVTGETVGLVVLIADYIRHVLHLNRYNPSPELINRYVEEIEIYFKMNDRSWDLRKDLINFLVQNIGVEISGEAYERIEVKKYRNLPNMTNRLRMGMCVAFDKIIDNINSIAHLRLASGIPEWEWLVPPFEGIRRKKHEFGRNEVRGTQPLLSRSGKPGGFRLRYGYSRNTGQGAAGVHPVTMYLSEMMSPGTSIKIDFMERPLTVFPVSTLTGPLVEFKDGSSERIESLTRIIEVESDVTQIWEMGDILLSPDDIPATETIELSAWTEEWWSQEVKRMISSKFRSIEYLANIIRISPIELEKLLSEPTRFQPSPEIALNLSRITEVPIHPFYSFNWNEIAISDLIRLIQKIDSTNEDLLPDDDDLKVILRQLGAPFIIHGSNIQSERFQPFIHSLRGKEEEITQILSEDSAVGIEKVVQELTKIPIRSLCHRRIGLKIIRVEKSEPRHINPPSHILFPIGSHGGTQRNLLKVKKGANVDIQISERFCTTCGESTYVTFCPKCLEETKQQFVCKTGHISDTRNCRECGQYAFPARIKPINVAGIIKSGVQKTGIDDLTKIKGVSFLNSKNRIPEHIIKGILRAKHNLFVYKDGTSRFDQTNAPLTYFTPSEVHSSVEDLLRLGYTHDVFGNDLIQDDQLIEINPFDVIVSKTAGEFLVDLSKFIDDELTFLYELPPYYRINSLNDITGFLIVGLSPFSMVAVIGRIIGYTENNVIYAHPLWHILKTRNCNGDIDSITLLLDVLLNFSMEFVPTLRGGTMDVPAIINLSDEWEETSVYASYDSILMNLSFFNNLIENPLKEELLSYKMSFLKPPLPISHNIDNVSRYNFENLFRESKIVSKIETELRVLSRIRGVKEGEFVDDILVNDFLPKITTSMTRFFLQPVRCNTCNTTFRRVPLSNCPVCHRRTIGLTLSEGWVLRYLQIVNQLKDQYNSDISEYCHSWVELVELNKRLLFEKGPRPTTLI
ncbi:MAG: hypothetical protein JSW11_06655 [Candidatus Heimdallarchaeota archaeon]|nr:MAG: hypothetical protein JSW11_06655 [Candidatus Heimdallarchaeota archaeon]